MLLLQFFRAALLGGGTLSIGTGLTLSYEGGHKEVTLLAWYVLGVLLLIVGSAFWVLLHRRQRGEAAPSKEQILVRELAEQELRQIASEQPRVSNPQLVFNKGAEDTLQRWTSAAREYIETVQGPAAEARFLHAADQRVAAVEIANDLDQDRLPSAEAVRAAGTLRRERSGVYPSGTEDILIPGLLHPAGSSPAERREHIDNLLYPPRDDRRELGEECDMFALKMRVFNEEQEWKREKAISRAVQELREADPDLDPHQARKDAEDHFQRSVETAYAMTMRGEAVKLFDMAREQGAIAAKARRTAERPLAVEMGDLPNMYVAIARRLGYEAAASGYSLSISSPEDLAQQLDSLMREGIDLVAELNVPVEPEATNGGWKLEGGGAPDEWWDKADGLAKRIRELLIDRHPALLTDYRDGYNAHLKKERDEAQAKRDPAEDKRSTAEKMLGLANFERSGPKRVVEASLEGLAAARHRLSDSQPA